MRKILLFTFLIFSINAYCQIPRDGLVAYYPFNSDANDATGKGNNGVVYNASLVDDRFGVANSAYYFDGIDDYITFPNLIGSTGEMSISVWVKLEPDLVKTNAIITNWGDTTNLRTFNIRADTNAMGYSANIVGQNGNQYLEKSVEFNSQWDNLIITFNTENFKFYLNGNLADSATGNYGNLKNGFYNSHIGTHNDLVNFFHGTIDDILIYNRTLSKNEIDLIYNQSLCLETVYDTLYTIIQDTNYITIQDTSYVTIRDSISVTDTLIIDAVLTGINTPSNVNTLKIYPNPAKTHIYINNGDYESMNGYTVKIDNMLGQTVFSSLIDQQEFYINISDWTGKGTYFVYIIDSNSEMIEVKKIIIQ